MQTITHAKRFISLAVLLSAVSASADEWKVDFSRRLPEVKKTTCGSRPVTEPSMRRRLSWMLFFKVPIRRKRSCYSTPTRDSFRRKSVFVKDKLIRFMS